MATYSYEPVSLAFFIYFFQFIWREQWQTYVLYNFLSNLRYWLTEYHLYSQYIETINIHVYSLQSLFNLVCNFNLVQFKSKYSLNR